MVMFQKERFIEACRAALKEGNAQAAIRELVTRAVSEPAQVVRALGELQRAGVETIYRADDLTILNLCYAVTNPLDQITAAIHVYGGDFFATPRSEWDPRTLKEQPYDVAHTLRAFEESNERLRGKATRS
jgi:hypothetical protein